MGIVEGEPDHTGLGSMARALQRLLRGLSGAGTADRRDREWIASHPRLSHQTEKKVQGRNTSAAQPRKTGPVHADERRLRAHWRRRGRRSEPKRGGGDRRDCGNRPPVPDDICEPSDDAGYLRPLCSLSYGRGVVSHPVPVTGSHLPFTTPSITCRTVCTTTPLAASAWRKSRKALNFSGEIT
jgi:hypothetical protein